MKRLFVFFLLVLCCFQYACGEDEEDDETGMAFNGIAVARTDDPIMPIVVIHEDGNSLTVLASENRSQITEGIYTTRVGSQITGGIYTTEAGKSVIVWGGDDGLPTRAFADGYTILLSNYTSDTVDLAIIDPKGEVEIQREVLFDHPEPIAAAPSILYSEDVFSINESIEFAGIIVGAFFCVKAAILFLPAGVVCGDILLTIVAAMEPEDESALKASSTAFGVFASAAGCIPKKGSSCVGWALNIGKGVVTASGQRREDEIKAAERTLKETSQPSDDGKLSFPTDTANTITGEDGAKMVLIPAGEFEMGGHWNDELPVHTVYLDSFYIDVFEVTNSLYRKFMEATGHRTPKLWNDDRFNQPDQPVINVSWHDAMAYAQWAGKRLPTEAEWEKAARGGLVSKRYPWGDTIDSSNANYAWNVGRTVPVGTYSANGYGLYDMAGNVWEWCLDEWDPNFYAKSPRENPLAGDGILIVIGNFTDVKSPRVLRGGSWYYFNNFLRVADRVRGGDCGPAETAPKEKG